MANNEPITIEPTGIIRGAGGRFLPGTKPPKPITSANAREMQEKRWAKAASRARQRIVREAAAIDPEVRDVYDANALMLAKQYTTIIDSDKPRMDDAEKLAQMLGLAPSRLAAQESVPNSVTNNTLVVSDDVASLIHRLLGG